MFVLLRKGEDKPPQDMTEAVGTRDCKLLLMTAATGWLPISVGVVVVSGRGWLCPGLVFVDVVLVLVVELPCAMLWLLLLTPCVEVVTGAETNTDVPLGMVPVPVVEAAVVVVVEWLVLLAMRDVIAARWWCKDDLWASSWARDATSWATCSCTSWAVWHTASWLLRTSSMCSRRAELLLPPCAVWDIIHILNALLKKVSIIHLSH